VAQRREASSKFPRKRRRVAGLWAGFCAPACAAGGRPSGTAVAGRLVRSTREHRAGRRRAPGGSQGGRLGRTQRGGTEFGQSCRERLARIAFANGSLPSALQSPEVSDQLSDEDENDHAFHLHPAQRMPGASRQAQRSVQSSAIEHPMVPEELCHSFALGILCAALTSPAWCVLDCAFADSEAEAIWASGKSA
jgi:hypothetical protein